MECLAGLGASVLMDVAGLDHVARPLQHFLDAVAIERLAVGSLRLDSRAASPHQRRDGEDVAAGAGARQEVALHVAAERRDLVGVFADFGEACRRLLRIETGLAEQILVVEQRRDVGVKRHAVEPAVIGGHRHVALDRGFQLRPVLDLVGDVDELSGSFELRPVDQIHAHEVGHLAAGDGLRDLRHHFGMRDVSQVDLAIGIFFVPGGDEGIDHARIAAAPLPHLKIFGKGRQRHSNQQPRQGRPAGSQHPQAHRFLP